VEFAVAALVFVFFLLVGGEEELSDVNHRSSFFRCGCNRQTQGILAASPPFVQTYRRVTRVSIHKRHLSAHAGLLALRHPRRRRTTPAACEIAAALA
ncbi:MAG TPA: hypothetical protein VFX82_11695, partial [Desulfobacterales bacterium]|nr:hypothetical protein [Desulfobacterales bacterium]